MLEFGSDKDSAAETLSAAESAASRSRWPDNDRHTSRIKGLDNET